MIKDFNLVISTYRGRENDCISELWYLLKNLGDSGMEFSLTGLPGLIVAKTTLDPLEVVTKIGNQVSEKPWYFRFLLKIVPIQLTVNTDIELIREKALELAKKSIAKGETYRVLIRKRLTDIRAEKIIEAIAPKIGNKVNLEQPDKIILLEIIGDVTGIAVIKPEHIVSVQRIKRQRRVNQLNEK